MKSEKRVKGEVAKSFEELYIYQHSRELANAIYTVTKKGGFGNDFSLIDQIRKSTISVLSNIAEGFERGSKAEFIQFLFIAKGSCGEARAQLQIANDQKYISASEYNRLCGLCRKISGMISNFIAHLKKTDYQGEKFSQRK